MFEKARKEVRKDDKKEKIYKDYILKDKVPTDEDELKLYHMLYSPYILLEKCEEIVTKAQTRYDRFVSLEPLENPTESEKEIAARIEEYYSLDDTYAERFNEIEEEIEQAQEDSKNVKTVWDASYSQKKDYEKRNKQIDEEIKRIDAVINSYN